MSSRKARIDNQCDQRWIETRLDPLGGAPASSEQRVCDTAKSEPGLTVSPPRHSPKSVRKLLERYPHLRPPVIHGIVRESEIMNVIAAPKTGKSWMVLGMAICVAAGKSWLDRFVTQKGDVLILDNELHGETIADRIPPVAAALGVPLREIEESLHVESLRGRLCDLFRMDAYFNDIAPGRYRMIIIDALYRFMPAGFDENSNGDIAQIYNFLDAHAARLGCVFVLVHHASKGSQRGKSITDMGAGAGSQSRATDAHLVLCPHHEEGAIVLGAEVRSWDRFQPLCLRWQFPVWIPDDTLHPGDFRSTGRPSKKPAEGQKAKPGDITVDRFVRDFITAEPDIRAGIVERAKAAGIPVSRAGTLLELAQEKGLVFRHVDSIDGRHRFANLPQKRHAGEGGVAKPTPPPERSARGGVGGTFTPPPLPSPLSAIPPAKAKEKSQRPRRVP